MALICEGCCDFPPAFLFTLVHPTRVPRPSAIGLCRPATSPVTHEPELDDPTGYSKASALRTIVERDPRLLLAVVGDCK